MEKQNISSSNQSLSANGKACLPMPKCTLNFAVSKENGVVKSIGKSYVNLPKPKAGQGKIAQSETDPAQEAMDYYKQHEELEWYKSRINSLIDKCYNLHWLECIYTFVRVLLN